MLLQDYSKQILLHDHSEQILLYDLISPKIENVQCTVKKWIYLFFIFSWEMERSLTPFSYWASLTNHIDPLKRCKSMIFFHMCNNFFLSKHIILSIIIYTHIHVYYLQCKFVLKGSKFTRWFTNFFLKLSWKFGSSPECSTWFFFLLIF